MSDEHRFSLGQGFVDRVMAASEDDSPAVIGPKPDCPHRADLVTRLRSLEEQNQELKERLARVDGDR